jgi:hypothetical protein
MADASSIEKELEAIKAVNGALEPFEAEARLRILQYATQHLGIPTVAATSTVAVTPEHAERSHAGIPSPVSSPPKVIDIRTLRDEKQPKTDIHMTAVVAYYLAELAPDGGRKDTITASDISKYFKQAGHPLPKQPRFTLQNARNAGYFDSAGSGAFKLNAVGYNLVAHSLPQSNDNGATKSRKGAKKVKQSANK